MSFFSAENITVSYGRQKVIENVSFQLEGGCLTGILGANGSGKTTLLKAICGIVSHGGRCVLEGKTLEEMSAGQIAKSVSYIPQRSGISIDISAADVVLMGFNPVLRLLQQPDRQMKDTAAEALARVSLEGKEQTNYQHLSEGQKQLCILARTLVSPAKLLLLDEPESAMDFRFRHQMLSLIKERTSAGQCSALVALHDPFLALNFCDRLIILSEGGILGIVEPKKDPLEKTEEMLSSIYGNVSLQLCSNRKGETQLVMLRED